MANVFNSKEEEKAYKLGKIDGMLQYQQHIIKNLKNEYEKIYKQRLDLSKSENND